MAKRILFIALLLSVGFFVHRMGQERHAYLKAETMLRHVKGKPFLTKAAAPWMLEQLDRDFAGVKAIPQSAIDETYALLSDHSPLLVRYRVVDNELYRYFPQGENISLNDNNTERALKTILQRAKLPNMDFLLSYFDGFPFCPAPSELKAPILVSAKLKNVPNGILIPDWRSIGHWWMSDIKAIKKAWTPWEKKRPFALWRGGLTKPVRHTLCKLSLQYPDLLDARINAMPEDHESWKPLHDEGVLGGRASWQEFLSCKYLPYVDGVMCAAPALQWRLLSGSLTFKPDSEEIQWFTLALQPHVHYVPVKSDLSDLIEKIKWAQDHDETCMRIAEQARQFANEHLLYHDVLNYFCWVLKRYGACQTLNAADLKTEM
ncbi:MAG: hypothetical protein KGQ49_05130, partial [Verrucomicrobia bacterium]|nr:hypothetical protein [Verrucomicrobiota bacterium]